MIVSAEYIARGFRFPPAMRRFLIDSRRENTEVSIRWEEHRIGLFSYLFIVTSEDYIIEQMTEHLKKAVENVSRMITFSFKR